MIHDRNWDRVAEEALSEAGLAERFRNFKAFEPPNKGGIVCFQFKDITDGAVFELTSIDIGPHVKMKGEIKRQLKGIATSKSPSPSSRNT